MRCWPRWAESGRIARRHPQWGRPIARLGRLTPKGLTTAINGIGRLYDQLDLVEVDDPLVRRAGELAQRHALRGYDAIHLAAAERVGDDMTVMVSGDREGRAPRRHLLLADWTW